MIHSFDYTCTSTGRLSSLSCRSPDNHSINQSMHISINQFWCREQLSLDSTMSTRVEFFTRRPIYLMTKLS